MWARTFLTLKSQRLSKFSPLKLRSGQSTVSVSNVLSIPADVLSFSHPRWACLGKTLANDTNAACRQSHTTCLRERPMADIGEAPCGLEAKFGRGSRGRYKRQEAKWPDFGLVLSFIVVVIYPLTHRLSRCPIRGRESILV